MVWRILLLTMVLSGLAMAQDNLAAGLRETIQACWSYPPTAEGAARIRIVLNRDGSLAGKPRIAEPSKGDPSIEVSALRAVQRCAPFTAVTPLLHEEKTEILLNFASENWAEATR